MGDSDEGEEQLVESKPMLRVSLLIGRGFCSNRSTLISDWESEVVKMSQTVDDRGVALLNQYAVPLSSRNWSQPAHQARTQTPTLSV